MYDIERLKNICSNFTVLLVDDEVAARTQVYDILVLFFQNVFSAQNGEEAFKIYKKEKIDLIITDIAMPKIDGFELMGLVRLKNPTQKIIVMSAHTGTNIIVHAIKSSVDGYILKPVEANQMFEAIEKAVLSLNNELDNIEYRKMLESKVYNQEIKLIKQLEQDYLTELPNKEKLQLDFKTDNFNEMILLNIDNFSQINSNYGYLLGDLLLKEVATFLLETVTASVYRGNGDEFYIALENS
ncbi:MAG: response regulator, partial [Campylobacterota bacterium]|nr:response regulator [Campylobacterota bacterium]